MLLEQIPEFLKTMQTMFESDESVSLSSEQYNLIKAAIQETTSEEDAKQDQARLYGILGRIGRRMKKTNVNHFYATEFQYIANSMMTTLKENDACRLDDTLADINDIFSRQQQRNKVAEAPNNHSNNQASSTNSSQNNKRRTDKRQIVSIFG